ncbi:MAG: hypothetical protein HY843_00830 [Bdellovibrio sp.]|nr:hypothetical protein [Bdellovibrio sp.]
MSTKMWVIIFPILFWAILFYFGFPPPNIDDLFFTGTAIQLVKDGRFFNPLLSNWTPFAKEAFFFQPPFHSCVLALWLYVFGISTKSILAFQAVCYSVISVFSGLLLNHFQFKRVLIYCSTIFLFGWMINRGFRQDGLGFAFLAVGLWFLIKDTYLRYFAGFSFLGGALLTAPLTIAYALPLCLILLYKNMSLMKKKTKFHYLQKRFGCFILAVFFVLILFSLSVDFRVSKFLDIFFWHASTRKVQVTQMGSFFIYLITHGKDLFILGQGYILLGVLLFTFFFKINKIEEKVKILGMGLLVGLILHIFFYLDVLYGALFFFAWLTNALFLIYLPFSKKIKRWLVIYAVFAFLSTQSTMIVSWVGKVPDPDPKIFQTIKAQALEIKDKKLVIDEIVGRYVFDFRFPENTVNWNFLGPAPRHWPTSISQKTSDSVWIIAKAKSLVCDGLPNVSLVHLFGRTFGSIAAEPKEILFIK